MAARAIAALLALAACSKESTSPQRSQPPPPPPAPAGPRWKASELVLDGMKLGEPLGARVAAPPYATPCDDDAVDSPKTRRALVYGARPCHGVTFPEDTTVIVFIDWAEPDDFTRPIRGIAWLGGHYIESRSTFPLKVGESKARAVAELGEPVGSFEITEKQTRGVWSFAGEIHAIIDGDLLAGFAIGPMPADPTAGDWEVIAEMYREATPRVGGPAAGAVSRANCVKVLARVDELLGQARDQPRDPAKLERELDECVAEATPAMIQCALAARTVDEIMACSEQ
jgi:hypothetical protein